MRLWEVDSKMSLYHAGQVAVYLVIMAAAAFAKQDPCSSPVPVEVLESAVNSLLSKLPDSFDIKPDFTHLEKTLDNSIPVEFGTIKYSGFQNLHRVGLIRQYCQYDRHMIAVHVRSYFSMGMELAFTFCGYKTRSLEVFTTFPNLLLKFYVLDEGQEFPLKLADVYPMYSRDVSLYLFGSDDFMSKIVKWVGLVLSPYYKYILLGHIAGGLYSLIGDMEKP